MSLENELAAVLDQVVIVTAGGQDIILDPKKLVFNEAILNRYVEEEAIWYNYYGKALAAAEKELQSLELNYDAKYSETFAQIKDDGASDKLSEAKAKAHPEVVALKRQTIETKYAVKVLMQHLRSWDKAHENAQSRGHMLRKEIDKLNSDIYVKNKTGDPYSDIESELDNILTKGNKMSENFRNKLEHLINTCSVESGSNTPDFILADYLGDCLLAFDRAVNARTRHYGKEEGVVKTLNVKCESERDYVKRMNIEE